MVLDFNFYNTSYFLKQKLFLFFLALFYFVKGWGRNDSGKKITIKYIFTAEFTAELPFIANGKFVSNL